MIRLTKWFRIRGSHRIAGIDGPCSKTHGHDWRIGVTVDGPMHNELLTIADTEAIKAAFWSIFGGNDHVDWNERLGCENASTEAIAVFVRGQLGVGPIGPLLCGVIVEESDGMTVEVVVR
jgi:6-pyruvoyltetrahydropterin/6-carboxytetrahydropterin synthase